MSELDDEVFELLDEARVETSEPPVREILHELREKLGDIRHG